MNIEKSYAKKMLAILDKWYNGGQYTSYTCGSVIPYSIDFDGRFGFGGCGGFMSSLYSYGEGSRNYWAIPSGSPIDKKEWEILAQLWIRMIGELFIPVRFVGIAKFKDYKKEMPPGLYLAVTGHEGTKNMYETVLVTEHDRKNYVSASHYKMAHTAIRYLFRNEMKPTAYHAILMKLQNPAISVLDCLVTASYVVTSYNSSMMLFRYWIDNEVNNTIKFPIPRKRGQIMRQIMDVNEGKVPYNNRITSFFTEVVEKTEQESKDLKSKINGLAKKRDYLGILKVIRELQTSKVKQEAITA